MITILAFILGIVGIYQVIKGLDDAIDFGIRFGGLRLGVGGVLFIIALLMIKT